MSVDVEVSAVINIFSSFGYRLADSLVSTTPGTGLIAYTWVLEKIFQSIEKGESIAVKKPFLQQPCCTTSSCICLKCKSTSERKSYNEICKICEMQRNVCKCSKKEMTSQDPLRAQEDDWSRVEHTSSPNKNEIERSNETLSDEGNVVKAYRKKDDSVKDRDKYEYMKQLETSVHKTIGRNKKEHEIIKEDIKLKTDKPLGVRTTMSPFVCRRGISPHRSIKPCYKLKKRLSRSVESYRPKHKQQTSVKHRWLPPIKHNAHKSISMNISDDDKHNLFKPNDHSNIQSSNYGSTFKETPAKEHPHLHKKKSTRDANKNLKVEERNNVVTTKDIGTSAGQEQSLQDIREIEDKISTSRQVLKRDQSIVKRTLIMGGEQPNSKEVKDKLSSFDSRHACGDDSPDDKDKLTTPQIDINKHRLEHPLLEEKIKVLKSHDTEREDKVAMTKEDNEPQAGPSGVKGKIKEKHTCEKGNLHSKREDKIAESTGNNKHDVCRRGLSPHPVTTCCDKLETSSPPALEHYKERKEYSRPISIFYKKRMKKIKDNQPSDVGERTPHFADSTNETDGQDSSRKPLKSKSKEICHEGMAPHRTDECGKGQP